MKTFFKFMSVCLVLVMALCVFAACTNPGDKGGSDGDSTGGGGGSTSATSYSITCDESDVYGKYYNLSTNYSKVGAGTTVTVTVKDVWNFLTVDKVYANSTQCTASSTANKYTFTMPSQNVTVTAEFTVNDVETDQGMTWSNKVAGINTPECTVEIGSLLFQTFSVDFGTEYVLNSTPASQVIEVISTNTNIIPADAISVRLNESSGNGAYADSATVFIDGEQLSTAGKTTLIFIDKDNDRAITMEVTTVASDN